MNPISKKIINKLSKKDKTELKSEKVELEKVELARKAPSILKDLKKLEL